MNPAHHGYLPDVLADRRRRNQCDLTLVQLGIFALLAVICAFMTGLCPEVLVNVFAAGFAICSWKVGSLLHRYRQLRKAPRA